MLTMVEGISRSEGGVGAMLLNQEKHFHLAEVFAIQLMILAVGLLQDFGIGVSQARGLSVRGTGFGTAMVKNRNDSIKYELGASILKAADDVSLTLGDRPILRDLNLEIRDIRMPGRCVGQIVSLLGPSGMGKTRLFRILAGLDQPTRGIGADRRGRQAGGARQGRRGSAGLSVCSRIVPCGGNLEVAGRLAGLSGEKCIAKAQSFLERFNLVVYAHRYPAQLSGGERQRVAIAQQFMCKREHFLLLD